MKILITGGSGLLGKYLVQTIPDAHTCMTTWYTNFVGLNSYQMDLTNKSQIHYVFENVKPDVVIHCAAIGSVDFVQENFQIGKSVIVEGTENLLKLSKSHQSKFVYISTNAVFAGTDAPYKEEAIRNPVNLYGKLKRDAENVVTNYNDWMIIRPFMLFGYPHDNGRQNWATILENKLSRNQEMKIVNDTWFQPTYAGHIAKAIWELIYLDKWNEVYNVACPDRVSLYGFARNFAQAFNFDRELIKPISSDGLKLKADRPVDSTYDLTKINELNVGLPRLKDGLKAMKNE